MPAYKSVLAMDGGITFFQTTTLMSLVSDVGVPVNLDNTLASVALTGGDFSVTPVSGGRRVSINEKTVAEASASGTGLQCVLSIGGVIHVVTDVTSQVITAGNPVTFPAWGNEINEPTTA